MPGPMPGAGQSGKIIFPGVPKHFDTPEQAAAFLRNSPKYVTKHARLIAQRAPGAFKLAGYSIKGTKLYQSADRPTWGPRPGAHGVTVEKVGDIGKPPAPKAPPKSSGGGVDVSWNGPDAGGSATVSASGTDSGPVIDLSGLEALNPNVGKSLDPRLAQGGAKLLDPKQADAIAGLQFDPQIHDLADAMARAPRDTAQQKRDVGHWYGQVLDSLRTAAGRDTAASKAGVDSVKDATAAIVGSLGGEANQGSALVGASGQDAVGTLAALGTAQDQYNADLAPLLQSEKAGALSAVNARGSSALRDLAMQLVQAKGKRGQTEAAARLDIQDKNNGILDSRNKTLIDILNANNGLDQQRYANAFGMEGAKISAGVSGAKVMASMNKGGPKDWSMLSPAAKNAVLKTVWGGILGPKGNPVAGKTETLNRAANVARSLGYDPAAVVPVVGQALRSQHPNWWTTSK